MKVMKRVAFGRKGTRQVFVAFVTFDAIRM